MRTLIKYVISICVMSCCVPAVMQAAPVKDAEAAKAIGIKACAQFYTVSTNPDDWQIVLNGLGDAWFVLGKERAIVVRRDGQLPDGRTCHFRESQPNASR